MKTNSSFALATLALAAILAPIHLAAQSGNMEVTVPFNFAVGSKTLPAGDYRVTVEPGLTRLDSVDGYNHTATFSFAVDGKHGQDKTSLVFKQYGNRYFLSQIWSGVQIGSQLPRSAAEREMLAKRQSGQTITLFASVR